MAKVKITGHASGTGILTVTAPNTSTDRTITLPDATGTLAITTDDDDKLPLAGGTLTGALVGTTASFSTADNLDTLTLTSTDADANVGPNLRMYRNSGSPADSDVLGRIDFEGRNDNSQDVVYGAIRSAIEDASDGTEDSKLVMFSMIGGTERNRLEFNPSQAVFNEDAQSIDVRVESSGNPNMFKVKGSNNRVGIGNGSPEATLDVLTAANEDTVHIMMSADDMSNRVLTVACNRDAADFNLIQGRNGGGEVFRVEGGGNVKNTGNSYGAISDERIKQDIADASSQWDDIKALKIRKYKLKKTVNRDGADSTPYYIGVVAQELESAGMNNLVDNSKPEKEDVALHSDFGTIVSGTADNGATPIKNEEGNITGYEEVFTAGENKKEVKYSILYMKAIKALQEAMDRIETLETKVTALEA